MRCPSRYLGAVTLRGKPVRCELVAGHSGQHGHSFAARYWDDPEYPVARCGRTDPHGGHADAATPWRFCVGNINIVTAR